jgi:glycyl-tRNA synthetase beta chain
MSDHQFLLEILCEEIPANALPGARRQLEEGFTRALAGAGFANASARTVSTVRRLVVHVSGLPSRQEDRTEQVLGPPVRAAFTSNGTPTPAAVGFARAQGVDVESLRAVEGPKGEVVAAERSVAGRSTPEVLVEAVPHIVTSVHFPKAMRWGNGEFIFVRPVHRVVALFGAEKLDTVVPISLFGVEAGSATLGHRVQHPGDVELLGVSGFEEYKSRLESAGVLVDAEARLKALREGGERLADEVGCSVRHDAALLREHQDLLEYPGLVRGAIDEAFLELPEEVLVTTLKHHQKCLVLEKDGKVAPYFLAVMDRADDPKGLIREGNEWVVGARLADAAFFFKQDRKKTLEQHAAGLERVTFHAKVGNYAGKAASLRESARHVAERCGLAANMKDVERAARLAKADLVTGMVGEFPELQGVVGGIYACLDGEPEAVWQAIYDQYSPAGMVGAIPRSTVGVIVGLADRLDTLASLFVVGEVPTGSQDPFALRRAGMAAVRIAAEADLQVDLADAVSFPFEIKRSGSGVSPKADKDALLAFLKERVRYYLTFEVKVPVEVADAVLEARWGVVPEDIARARALDDVRREAVFADLAVVFKRVRNIVAKGDAHFDKARLREPAERELLECLDEVEKQVHDALATRGYATALRHLAALAAPLDRFFTEVLVLCDDEALRAARLGLLRRVEKLFLELADISRLAAPAT